MSALDQQTVIAFCDHCNWAYQCWMLRKHLYDDNPQIALLKNPYHAYFFDRLEKILQEYWILEVAKLLDPPKQFGKCNLTARYIFENGNWDSVALDVLSKLLAKLERFGDIVKPARDKLLSHKDKDTIVSNVILGSFQIGADVEFFEALSAFANRIHELVVGGLYVFDDLTDNDVAAFMKTFSKGMVGA